MAHEQAPLPNQGDTVFLSWPATHTDLVFNHGIDLPGMAPFTLLETEEGKTVMRSILNKQIDAASSVGLGALLETPTFKASQRRAPENYRNAAKLSEVNANCVAFMADLRASRPGVPILISGLVGPSGDAYQPDDHTSDDRAEEIHSAQINAFKNAGADMVGAYTFTHASDAVGAVRAAGRAGIPIVVSFTVETDGRLPFGQSLAEVVAEVDERTNQAPAYYMVNCAHPDHLSNTLSGGDLGGRLKGLIVNASRKSHAELNNATELDAGDPEELGCQMGAILKRLPGLRDVGGCCGTDARHLSQIAIQCANQRAAF